MQKGIRKLSQAGFRSLSVLPIHPTGYSNSPYQPVSTCAGNPYLIDLKDLVSRGYLLKEELEDQHCPAPSDRVDYGWLYQTRIPLLKVAYQRFLKLSGPSSYGYRHFCSKNQSWLREYAQFELCKEQNGGTAWWDWPDDQRDHRGPEWRRFIRNHELEMSFWCFVQYLFYTQWEDIYRYAQVRDVEIIGDMPFFPAADSSDVWAHKNLFAIDHKTGQVLMSAGAPASSNHDFVRNWGNPTYVWSEHTRNDYRWFRRRIQMECQLCDCLRVDHAAALIQVYGIPAGKSTGEFIPGPEQRILTLSNVIEQEARKNRVEIIAEDLGSIHPDLWKTMEKKGWSGMRLQQYAFSSSNANSIHQTYYYPLNTVAYTGTHDNSTLRSYVDSRNPEELLHLFAYTKTSKKEDLPWELIENAYRSPANRVLVPMQDILGLDDRARMVDQKNWGSSWLWRLSSWDLLTPEIMKKCYVLSVLTGRFYVTKEKFQEIVKSIVPPAVLYETLQKPRGAFGINITTLLLEAFKRSQKSSDSVSINELEEKMDALKPEISVHVEEKGENEPSPVVPLDADHGDSSVSMEYMEDECESFFEEFEAVEESPTRFLTEEGDDWDGALE